MQFVIEMLHKYRGPLDQTRHLQCTYFDWVMLFSRAAFPIVLIATAISNSVLVHARLSTIRELFDVSFDNSVGGNCAQWGEARLNTIVSDAFDLAQVAMSVVDAAIDPNNNLHDEAVRLLAAWFLKPFLSAAEYSRIKGM
jgi:hypothetical protein